MKAIDALNRLTRNMPFDNPAWNDEDREYLRTIIKALEAQAEREAAQ